MTRELTPAEQAFIARTTAREESEAASYVEDGAPIKARRRRPLFLRPGLWSVVLFILPFALGGVFLYTVLQIPSALGGIENLELLNEAVALGGFDEASQLAGLDWLPDYLRLYEHKELIVAIIFLVFFTLGGLVTLLDLLKRRRGEQA